MAGNDGDRGGDLYDSDMGDGVTGGSVEFDTDKDGSNNDHTVVHGDDRHFSWDSDKDGNVSGTHGTEHDKSGNKPW